MVITSKVIIPDKKKKGQQNRQFERKGGERMIYMTERIVNLNDLKGMSNLAMARAANVKKMISEGAAPEIVSAQMEVLLRELTEINNFEFEIEVRKVRYCE